MKSELFVLGLYAWAALINIFSIGAMWKSTKVELYKNLMLAWISGTIGMTSVLVFANSDPFIHGMAYLVFFFFHFYLAKFLAELISINFKTRNYVLALAIGLSVTLVLYLSQKVHIYLVIFPLFVGIGAPTVIVGARALLFHLRGSSLALKGIALTVFISGLHAFSFTILYLDPFWTQVGITTGFALAIALTLFGPGVILEKVMEDKIKLELDLKYKAKVAQSTKLAALGEMAGGVAHEINNPLASIRFALDHAERMLASDNIAMDSLMNVCSSIKEQVGKMSVVVKSLLQFSHEEEQDPLQKVEANLLISRTLDFCREKFRSHQIDLRVCSSVSEVYIACRPAQISQILLNLLNNAYDAVKDNPQKWIEVKLEKNKGKVYLMIVDSGNGVSESVQSKLFQPFVSTKEVGLGTGLGLSVSKSIAISQGGDLKLLSSGNPTVFSLELPVLCENTFE